MNKHLNKQRITDIEFFRRKMRNFKKLRQKRFKREIRLKNYIKSISHFERFKNKKEISFFKTEAPKNFSFLNNTNNLLVYFEENGKALWNWRKVNFDLSKINYLWFDALSLLLSKINDEKYSYWWWIKWKLPEREDLKKLFFDSWFFPEWQFWYKNSWDTPWEMIWNFSNKKVRWEIAAKISEKLVWKRESKLSKQTYSTLIECMANTNNHAKCKWRITYFKENDHIKVCFIDLWIWILKHINAKAVKVLKLLKIPITSKWITDPWEIMDALLNDKDILDHRSHTKLPYRWTWMPNIRKYVDCAWIKNFTIICNNLFVNVSKNKYIKLNNEFRWTFYYREIHNE